MTMDLDDRQLWTTTCKRVAEYLSILYKSLQAERLPEDLCNMITYDQFKVISTPDPMEAMQEYFRQLRELSEDEDDDD